MSSHLITAQREQKPMVTKCQDRVCRAINLTDSTGRRLCIKFDISKIHEQNSLNFTCLCCSNQKKRCWFIWFESCFCLLCVRCTIIKWETDANTRIVWPNFAGQCIKYSIAESTICRQTENKLTLYKIAAHCQGLFIVSIYSWLFRSIQLHPWVSFYFIHLCSKWCCTCTSVKATFVLFHVVL